MCLSKLNRGWLHVCSAASVFSRKPLSVTRSPRQSCFNHKQLLWVGATLLVSVFGFSALYVHVLKRLGSPTQALIHIGNRHKLNRQWREAGEAFESAAQQFVQQGRGGEHDAANSFAEAANCYRKLRQTEFTKKAVQCLQRAADMFAEQGHFSIAARYLEDAGDLARSAGADHSDLLFAVQLYLRAADTWSGEDSPANAAGSRTKAAELMADCGRLSEAARLFEQLGDSAQSHDLLRFGAKELMLKSCLCLLATLSFDTLKIGEKAEQLAQSCNSFADSDELMLVTQLAAAADARDVTALDTAVEAFGQLNNIDDFARRRLEQLRNGVTGDAVRLQ